MTWEPVSSIRLRGNYQRAVRAPNIGELFSPTVRALTNLTADNCQGAAPVGNVNLTNVCIAQGATAGQIGSIPAPNGGQIIGTFVTSTTLRPETATTFTTGIVLTPRDLVPHLTISLDYFSIKVDNAITFATVGDAMAACFANVTAASATSPACTLIGRNPANGGLSGNPTTNSGVYLPETNLGRLETDGMDLTVNYNRDLGPVGLDLNFVGNWTDHLRFQAAPSSVNRDCVGYFSVNCGPSLGQIQPKFAWQQRTTLSFRGVSASLLWRHIGEVKYEGQADDYLARGFTAGNRNLFNGVITNQAPATSALAGQTRNFNRIAAFNYFDLTLQYEIGKKYLLALGAQNLFNKQPPIVGGQAGTTTADSGNTFPSTYDPLGRAYSASVRMKF